MKNRVLTTLLSFLMISLCSASVYAADDERAQKAIETRQGLLKVVGHYFGPIVGMAQGKVPFDAAMARTNSNKIAQLMPMIPDVFALDTRANGLESDTLDGVWENNDDFNSKAAIATERALALAAAADQGKGAFGKAVGAMGSACKSCHEDYRQK